MVSRLMARAVWLLSACVPLAGSADGGNPYETDPAAIRAGSALYASRCADCHGADAKGTRGPDLTALWAAGTNDERVFAAVRRGVDGSIMPPSLAPDNEIWAVVAYLRSISFVAPFKSERGNSEQGYALFTSLCAQCHRARGAGGTLGPDLSRIAQVRSREALLTAIQEPNAAISTGFRTATLRTKRGVYLQGVVKSEDAFSIQIVDTDERLQGYFKADLDSLTHDAYSLMPEFWPNEPSEPGLDDLLAFLGTLRDADTVAP